MKVSKGLGYALALVWSVCALPVVAQWSTNEAMQDLITTDGVLSLNAVYQHEGRFFVASTTSTFAAGIYYSDDEGQSWQKAAFNEPVLESVLRFTEDGNGTLLAFTRGLFGTRSVIASTDGGANWTRTPTATVLPIGFALTQFEAFSDTLYAVPTSHAIGMQRSVDGGATYAEFNTFDATDVSSFGAMVKQGDVLLLVTNGDRIFALHREETTWTLRSTTAEDVFGLLSTGTEVVSSGVAGFATSTDQGATWTPMAVTTTGIEGIPGLMVQSGDDFYVVIASATTPGIALLEDRSTLTLVNDGLEPTTIANGSNFFSLAATPQTVMGIRLGAAFATNLFQYDTGVGTAAEAEPTLPQQAVLAQNFPNPFNPTTTIRYQLTRPGTVAIRVFDTLGREVARLVNASQSAGMHETTLDATGLASGVYLYQLVQDGQPLAQRLLTLLK